MSILLRRGAAALALSAAFVFGPAAAQQTPPAPAPVTIRLVQTNDIDRMNDDKGRGGFARFAAVVKAERAKGGAVVVHGGDTISPSVLAGFDKGAHIIDFMNQIGFDAFVPGNHEFDFGPENFRARMAEAKFDVIASSVREKSGALVANTKDDKIMEVEGVKLGFYGLTTETTVNVSSPGDIAFSPVLTVARAKAKELRERGADLIIALAHVSLAEDINLVRSGAADVVIGGHDEHLLAFYDGKAVLTESGAQANAIIVTDLSVTKTVSGGKTTVSWTPNFRIIDSASVTPDPEIAALVATYQKKLDAETNVAIGVSETALDTRRATVRAQEAAFGNLLADAMRAAYGADVAITNGGGIRADKQYAEGVTLIRRDILAELPFGNKSVMIEVTGAQIKAALENGFSQVRELAGKFPQVSGMAVEADLKEPSGSRVKSVTVGGAALDPAKTYKLVTNDFMARGGDAYAMFADAKRLIDEEAGQIMASQLIDFIAKAGKVAPRVEGRIVFK